MKLLISFTTLLAVAFASPSGYGLPLGYSGFPYAYTGLPLAHSGQIIAAPASLSSQFHSQDTLGQYSYGYSDGLSSKKEIKSLDGVTRGSYSYVDAKGKLQTVDYTADAIHGFRVAGTNLPKPIKDAKLSLPAPIREDPAIIRQREMHLAAVEEAKIRNRTPIKPIDLTANLPRPVVDTPEVAKVKVEHLAAIKDAEVRNTLVKEIPIVRAPAVFSTLPTLPIGHTFTSLPTVEPWSGLPVIRSEIRKPFVYSVNSLHPGLIDLRDGRWIFGGFQLFQPVFFLRTPEIIKQIVVKDFNHFQNRRTILNAKQEKFFSSMLASMKGKEWREMRNALSPAFTGSKMRHMFPFITKCANQIVEYFDEEYTANGPTPHNMKQCFAKYANDVIASCAFGLECDSFKDPENIIYKIGNKFLEFQKPLNLIKSAIMILFPRFSALIGLKFFDDKSKKLFFDIILNNMDEREKFGIHRPDLISILMELKKGQNLVSDNLEHNDETQPKRTWTDEELVAQCFSFFLAGFETVSSTLVFAAHELAVNTDVQMKLVQEIEEMNERLNGKDISYEQLQSLKYLDMVVNETLRKWPLAVVVDRECVKDYDYEDEDGLKFTIEKGKGIWVPVYPIHMNPNYFPEPEKFYPERYSEDNKSWADMNAFLSFGTGPRNCIGSRFALMELKAVIYYILLKFQFKVCKETDVPIKLKKTMLGLFPEKDVKLFVQPR